MYTRNTSRSRLLFIQFNIQCLYNGIVTWPFLLNEILCEFLQSICVANEIWIWMAINALDFTCCLHSKRVFMRAYVSEMYAVCVLPIIKQFAQRLNLAFTCDVITNNIRVVWSHKLGDDSWWASLLCIYHKIFAKETTIQTRNQIS